MNLLGGSSWKSPRLTLFGFSRWGACPFDGAVGGQVTFVLPIRRDVSLVVGGGAIFLPARFPNGASTSSTAIRADVVFRREGGRSFNVGVGNTRGVSGVSFGGIF